MISRIYVLPAFVLALVLATPSVTQANEVKKIGLSVPNMAADYFISIQGSLVEHANEHGIEVITMIAENDSDTQIEQVKELLQQDIDAFVYVPTGATAAPVPARMAREAGVPVINMDRNSDEEPGDTFIAGEGTRSAYEVCSHLLGLAQGKGKMLIIHGQKGLTPEVNRAKGCFQAIDETPDVEVVGQAWSERWAKDEGYVLTKDLLSKNPKVSIIFGQADGLALGAAQAVKEFGADQRIYVGGYDGDVDALLALRDGVFDVTATQSTRAMGALAVNSAIALVAGEVISKTQIIDAELTTQANVQKFIDNHP